VMMATLVSDMDAPFFQEVKAKGGVTMRLSPEQNLVEFER
jgi:hypothetical protein